MTAAATALLVGLVWSGTATVDVMIWEGGGEHPYNTTLTLQFREAEREPITDATGHVVGHRTQLIADQIQVQVHHEVRGLLNCKGTGEEILTAGLVGQIVRPLAERAVTVSSTGVRVPAEGAYQLELPRAFGGFACGTNNRNARDRRVGIGSGLFYPTVVFADSQLRVLEGGGAQMRGTYVLRRARSADGSQQHLVRKEVRVEWDLRRKNSR